MIITKSISRFSRNTVDCLKYTRKLKDMNIAVFFEKENINTLDSKGEVLMTIMAALAQQESESLSANVRLGIQFRNQQGKVKVNHNWFLGYTKDEDGKLVIVPEEAEVVRRIYREFLEGASLIKIRRGLEADGILNGAKHARWYETNIRQILTNEKYIGDALLQKTYTVSVLDKKRSVNDGAMPKYYVCMDATNRSSPERPSSLSRRRWRGGHHLIRAEQSVCSAQSSRFPATLSANTAAIPTVGSRGASKGRNSWFGGAVPDLRPAKNAKEEPFRRTTSTQQLLPP